MSEPHDDDGTRGSLDDGLGRIEIAISTLLRVGVVLSLALIVVGTVVAYRQHPEYLTQTIEPPRLAAPESEFPHSLETLIAALRTWSGEAIVTLGLLVLIATPVMRVALSVLYFLYQNDRVYALITAAVLCLLLLSLVLGRIE